MSFLEDVDRGLLGKNEGLPNGLKNVNRYIYGTQKARYYLIGGESGTGKTTMTDYMFLFTPYDFAKANNIKLYQNYWSFEQGKIAKRTSWASKIMYSQHGLRLPGAYLMGKGKNRMTSEHRELCISVDAYLEELFDSINFMDEPIGPTKFAQYLYKYAMKHGKFVQKPVYNDKGEHKKDAKGNPMYEITGWIPNDPDAIHEFMMDHIAYAFQEKPTLKQNIDTISKWCVYFRERCGFTFIIIQQFNTELASVERQKFKKNALAPQRVDFGDSRYTYQDADVVFGMLNPRSYDIPEFMGYDVDRMRGYGIWLFLMKNRHDGPANRVSPLFMDPVAGTFEDLPERNADVVAMTGFDPLDEIYERATMFNESIKLYEEK